MHQSSELWLKLAAAEVVEATRLIAAGDLGGAIRLLRRANHCLKLVTDALDMLEHLSPWEYQEIRKVLGHGSGFDSPGFRERARGDAGARRRVPRGVRGGRALAGRAVRPRAASTRSSTSSPSA